MFGMNVEWAVIVHDRERDRFRLGRGGLFSRRCSDFIPYSVGPLHRRQ